MASSSRGSVSIHAPARGATQASGLHGHGRAVSIHAPARGATKDAGFRDFKAGVSIHAPARGATKTHRAIARWAMFQSTRPHGARHYTTTHAERINCFNPRARTGRDLTSTSVFPNWMGFQSTRPHGARPPCTAGRPRSPCFNPRARTGRDGMLITQPYHCKKSFTIANLRALSRKNGKDHDRRSDASTKTTACRNANLRGGQRSLGVRGTRAGAANCVRGTR